MSLNERVSTERYIASPGRRPAVATTTGRAHHAASIDAVNLLIALANGAAPDTDIATTNRARQAHFLGSAYLLVALGVFGQAAIGYVGRTSGSFPAPLYFLTLCAIYAPAVVIVASGKFSGNAMTWFTLYSCVAQLICRFMLYPDQFVYHDEIVHQQAVQSIDSTGHLFGPNWELPVVPYYPGTEITTSAIQQLTKLPLHAAGMLVLIIVRIIMVLALIRIAQRISQSATVGCLAALIFATNPQFIFFYSLFSYESVALPLAFFAVYLFSIRRPSLGIYGLAPALAAVAALALTHHLTAVGLLLLFWGWWLFSVVSRKPVRHLLTISLISTALVVAWTWVARSEVVPYIGQEAVSDAKSLVSLLEGKSVNHFFTDSAAYRSPIWEILLSLGAVLITGVALLPALWHGVRRRRVLRASALTLLFIAAAYPLWPIGHIPPATSETADRSAPFLFVGVSYVGARWYYDRFIVRIRRHRRGFSPAWSVAFLSIALSVCLVGNTIVGAGPNWVYGPGPYLVEADSRSIDSLALDAAYWEGAHIPSQSRAFTDRDNALLAETYGDLRVLTALSSKIQEGPLSTLLLSGSTASDLGIACKYHVQYLIADRRLASSLPHLGVYIDNGEYLQGTRKAPPPASALTKFDLQAGAERIYDNGAIRIYDLKGLSCAGQR